MLVRLGLEHFKCFALLKLPLGRLTLLAGTNAAGKSSVLQALVLLHQTIREQEWSTRLLLNGGELRLGTVGDVIDQVTGRIGFRINLVDDQRTVGWTFEAEDRRDMSAAVSAVRVRGAEEHWPRQLRFLLPFDLTPEDEDLARRLRRLCYLTAERVGPREVYALYDPSATQVVGPCGEGAVSLLHWGRDEAVLDGLALPGVAVSRPGPAHTKILMR